VATFTRQQIESLWVQAGGKPTASNMASAIALAESGGRSDATNSNDNGTVDRGLWQINSIHGSLSTFDPLANARAAVSISGNGTNWRPWCTAWSNGRCGGTFMGTGAPVLKFFGGIASAVTTPNMSLTTDPVGLFGNPLDPSSWANAFLKPIGQWAWYALLLVGGVALMMIGVALLIKAPTTEAVKSGVKLYGKVRSGG